MLSNIYLHTSNPFNIRYSKRNQWKGQVGSYKGFCIFESDKYAIRAFLILCHVYKVKYNVCTISDFINRYAPPSENNTKRYLSDVSDFIRRKYFDSNLGFDTIQYSNPDYMFAFTKIIALYETGKHISFADFINIYQTIKI